MNQEGTVRVFDIFLVGVGGQGVLTIAEFLSKAAFAMQLPVSYYPSRGMAQRGGFVKAQVRLGRDRRWRQRRVLGPNVPERGADLVIALERSEALKAIRFAKPGGEFVLYDDVWAPTAVLPTLAPAPPGCSTSGTAAYPTTEQVQEQVRKAGSNLYYVSSKDLPAYQGRPVSDNVYVLGLIIGRTRLRDLLDSTVVAQLLRDRWPKASERNLYAFQAGVEAQYASE